MGEKLDTLRQFVRTTILEGILREAVTGGDRLHLSPRPLTLENIKEVPPHQQIQTFKKPRGLWYSCGDSWKNFSEEELDRSTANLYQYRLKIDHGQMLVISSVEEFEAFQNSQYTKQGKLEVEIDWPAVARDYAGIEICPYRSEMRDHLDKFWYYTWDVASGVIWKPSAILSLDLISEPNQ